jgi:hydroxyacylglutathione hydrolase
MLDDDATVLDTREVTAFNSAHIAASLNIAARTAFDPWAGRLLDPEKPIILVSESWEQTTNIQRRLFRMGFDNVEGFLQGGIRNWIQSGLPTESTGNVNVHDLDTSTAGDDYQLLDVRTDGEWKDGHLPNATHIYAAELPGRMSELDKDRPVVTYCGSDFRANVAASLLQRAGFKDVSTLLGSYSAWTAADLEVE